MITYNHEAFIAQAIEGVMMQQTSFDIELIIGEDCSTDRTREICLSLKEKYPDKIRLLLHNSNLGMMQNSKLTIKSCTGKYIAFCEGDDYWHNPMKLQKQVDFLESHLDYGMVHSNAHHYYQKDKRLVESVYKFQPVYDDGNAYFDIITEKRPIATLTVCARKDLVFKVIDENPECTDDHYLMGDDQVWMELSRLAKFKYMDESLATYNIMTESASHGINPDKQLRFQLSAKEIRYHYLSKYPCPPEVALQTKYSRIIKVLNCAIRANNKRVAQDELQELREMNLKPPWTFSDYVVYWGCRNRVNSFVVRLIRLIWSFKNLYKST